MDSLSEVAPGSLWTVDNGLDASRDRVGSIGLALCRPLDATHTGVHALAFSSAITTSTVSETGQLSLLEIFVGRYCVGPRKQRGESCIRRKGSELPQLSMPGPTCGPTCIHNNFPSLDAANLINGPFAFKVLNKTGIERTMNRSSQALRTSELHTCIGNHRDSISLMHDSEKEV